MAVQLSRLPRAMAARTMSEAAPARSSGSASSRSSRPVIEHAVDAVGRQQQPIAGGERLLDHVHVGPPAGCRRRWSARAASGDTRSRLTSARGSFAITLAIHESSPVNWRKPSAGEPIQPAVADVADRQSAVDDKRRDDRGAHARIGARTAGLFEDLHVRQMNRGANQISRVRQGRIDAERPADPRQSRTTSSTASTAVRAAISPALWPPMPSAITQSRRSSSIAKRSWLVGLDRALLADSPRLQHAVRFIGHTGLSVVSALQADRSRVACW